MAFGDAIARGEDANLVPERPRNAAESAIAVHVPQLPVSAKQVEYVHQLRHVLADEIRV